MLVDTSRGEHRALDASHPAWSDLDDGYVVEVLPATPSTNAVVAERARAGAADGLVVATDHQTVGRGRLDRVWETPAGTALTFSVLLRPDIPGGRWPWLPLLTGVAVVGGLRQVGVQAVLKWPNDVLIGDRKLAGILVERVEAPAGVPSGPAAVLGVGLNVAMSAAELPVQTATSLAVEGHDVEREVLLAAILASLRSARGLLGDPAGLRAAYLDLCVTVGQQVRAELPGGGRLLGEAVGVDGVGRLVVRGEAGEQAVAAGDVVHVRALSHGDPAAGGA